MKTQIQLILATLALTALIWVYADRLSLESTDVTAGITVTTDLDAEVVVIEETLDGTPRIHGPAPELRHAIQAVARGPKAAVHALAATGGDIEFEVVLETDLNRQESHDLVRSMLSAELQERGLELLDMITPATFRFEVDEFVRVPAEIVPEPGRFQSSLEGRLTVRPKTVTAKLRESDLDKLDADNLEIHLPVDDLLESAAGTTANPSFTVPVEADWSGVSVTFQPEEVSISAKLRQTHERQEIKLIPVHQLLPWDWPAGTYRIEWREEADRITKIEVRVPIGKARPMDSADVTAYIPINDTDLPTETGGLTSSYRKREIRFDFSDEFSDVELISPPQTVEFRVVPRGASADVME
jgi:hypothetical protein